MRGLIILGATTFAKLVHFYAVNDLGMKVLGFAVDEAHKVTDEFISLPVFTWTEVLEKFPVGEITLFVAVGYKSLRLREAVYARVKGAGYELTNIVCASGFVAMDVVMGDNNIVMPGAVIEPGVVMGANNVVWSNATICHDCIMGSHNFIAANSTIGGAVSLGNQNFLGLSSVIFQGRRIGNETLIGAQTMVNQDTQSLSEYRGIPAKRISSIDPDIGVSVG
jgi:sugar O-acyltransferase (sialic acid O-acetyltransferase NeuD family)